MTEVTECTPDDREAFWLDAPQERAERPVSRWDGGNVREYAERVRAAENAAQQREMNRYFAAWREEPTEGERS